MLALALIVSLLVAAAVVAVLLLSRGGAAAPAAEPRVALPFAENSLVRIDTATNRLVAAVPAGRAPAGPAVGDGSVWIVDTITSTDSRTLLEVDPGTATVTRKIPLEDVGPPTALAAGGSAVWLLAPDYSDTLATELQEQRLWRIDPETGSIGRIELKGQLWALAFGEGSVWVAAFVVRATADDDWPLYRVDPATGEVVATVAGAGSIFPGSQLLAAGYGEVWTAYDDLGATFLLRVDPLTSTPEDWPSLELASESSDLAIGEDGVWVTSRADDAVLRIGPESKQVSAPIRVGRSPGAIAAGEGAVWVANTRDGTVSRIDPETLDVTTIDVGGTPRDLAVGAGSVWVNVYAS